MSQRDIHKNAFDEGTRAKLAIFKDYLIEWLPVFFARKEIIWQTINIFDFFAGPGSDNKGIPGTPLIILDELGKYIDLIRTKNLKVNLYFNEYDKQKFEELKLRLHKQDLLPYNSIRFECLDFKVAFEKEFPIMSNKGCANLIFLDQNGIKHITEDVFSKLINLKQTDFLFFISSSTIKRFSEHPSIVQHIKLSAEQLEKTPYHKVHRIVLDYYKSLIPKNKEYYLAPFSLKKNAGLYGLIFGTGHVLGIEKFLKTCWGIDPERGEANFDIDDDKINPGQVDLFTGSVSKPKKVDLFEKELKSQIKERKLKTDKDVYLFTITNGFTPKHSRKIISELVKAKVILDCTLELSSKICKKDAQLTTIKLT